MSESHSGTVGGRRLDPAWLSVPAGLLAAGGAFLFAPLPGDGAAMLAITVGCVALWIGTPVDPWFTGLGCLLAVGVVFSTDLALVGFQSPATWLIVFGVVLGEAVRHSGLAAALEAWIFGRLPASGTPTGSGTEAGTAAGPAGATRTFRYLLGTFSAISLALVVVIPSSLVRVFLLGPILLAVSEVFAERRTRIGLVLGPLFVTYYAGPGVLTGSVVNIVISGIVESSTDVAIGWVEWLVWLGPVMGLGRGLVVAVLAYVLFRPREARPIDLSVREARDSPDRGEVRRMVAFLLVGVAIWATDALHGLHPLYGVLAVVLLAFAPRIGVADADAIADADVSIAFFIGAIFAIAEGLQQTGVTDAATEVLLGVLDVDAPLVVVLAVIVVAALVLTLLVEGLAAASVMTPVLVSFATSAGLPLEPIVMIEATALSTYFFPYQSAVLVAMLGFEGVESMDLIKMAAVCSLATLLVLLPIQIAIFAVLF